jgi:protein-disulfide isomerase
MTDDSSTRRQYVSAVIGILVVSGCLGEESNDEPVPTGQAQGPGTEAIAPATQVDSLPTPVQGDPDADVTVSVYEDFACPHCREYTLSVLPKISDEFIESEKIRYERYDFPIPVDEQWSWAAANAARSVQNVVGMDAFWRYSHLLYENQQSYSYELLGNLAEQVAGDPATVRTAAEGDAYHEVLRKDRKRGQERGVTGTPTVFVNDRHVHQSYEKLRQAIRDELDSSE